MKRPNKVIVTKCSREIAEARSMSTKRTCRILNEGLRKIRYRLHYSEYTKFELLHHPPYCQDVAASR